MQTRQLVIPFLVVFTGFCARTGQLCTVTYLNSDVLQAKSDIAADKKMLCCGGGES